MARERHTHTVACFSKSSTPSCGIAPHKHSNVYGSCYKVTTDRKGKETRSLSCSMREHNHAEACYAKKLICGK